MNENYDISVGPRQRCVESLQLLNVDTDGYMKEILVRVGGLGAWMKLNGVKWHLVTSLTYL